MEWTNRGGQAPHQPGQAPAPGGRPTNSSHKKGVNLRNPLDKFNLSFLTLLFSGTILIVAVLLFIAFGSNARSESRYVDETKLQAVFLDGGQVYFGRIRALNKSHLRLTDVYYLRVNQQVQPGQDSGNQNANDVSLVKLGCELHGPQDEMIINRDQVSFWENLKEEGQVTQAVLEFIEQNPDGQDCDNQPGAGGSIPADSED